MFVCCHCISPLIPYSRIAPPRSDDNKTTIPQTKGMAVKSGARRPLAAPLESPVEEPVEDEELPVAVTAPEPGVAIPVLSAPTS